MESALTNACRLKLKNFEGPFDLLFHLIEKDQFNIYDIPINEITSQYMDYLATMEEMDLEITSEFLVMAATLLHIKSKMLLPEKPKLNEDEKDPREELVAKLLEYRRFKEISQILKEREIIWSGAYYKLPEAGIFSHKNKFFEADGKNQSDEKPGFISPELLINALKHLMEKNTSARNNTISLDISSIIEKETITLRSKIREVLRALFKHGTFKFFDLFHPLKKSRIEVVTGFLAILELSKIRKIFIDQKHHFGDIEISKPPSQCNTDLKEFKIDLKEGGITINE